MGAAGGGTLRPRWLPVKWAKRGSTVRYLTTEEARLEGRCVCEGCGACRGEEGHPCGSLTLAGERCPHCRRAR